MATQSLEMMSWDIVMVSESLWILPLFLNLKGCCHGYSIFRDVVMVAILS